MSRVREFVRLMTEGQTLAAELLAAKVLDELETEMNFWRAREDEAFYATYSKTAPSVDFTVLPANTPAFLKKQAE